MNYFKIIKGLWILMLFTGLAIQGTDVMQVQAAEVMQNSEYMKSIEFMRGDEIILDRVSSSFSRTAEEPRLITEGDFIYEIKTYSGIDFLWVERYLGNDVDVTIPDTAQNMIVMGLNSGTFLERRNIETLTLPKSIGAVSSIAFSLVPSLRSIEAGSNREVFYSIDGVLYAGTNIWVYPASREGENYIIPNGINYVHQYAFMKSKYLKKIIVPETVDVLSSASFCHFVNPLHLYLKRTKIESAYYLDGIFFGMPIGSAYVVKLDSVKEMLDSKMKDTAGYASGMDKVSVMIERYPSTQLQFVDGSVKMELTCNVEDMVKLYELAEIFPADTTDAIKWTSSNPETAVVMSNGLLSTRKGGRIVITGEDESGHSIQLNLVIKKPMTEMEIYVPNGTVARIGEAAATIGVRILPEDCLAYLDPVRWSVEDPKIAQLNDIRHHSVDVIGKYPGITQIYAEVEEDGIIKKEQMEIIVQAHIADAKADPIPVQKIHDDEFICPKPIIRYQNLLLKENVDYTLHYYHNFRAGIATIVVEGIGLYYNYKNNDFSPMYILFTIEEAEPGKNIPEYVKPDLPVPVEVAEEPEVVKQELSIADKIVSYKKNKCIYLDVQNLEGNPEYQSMNRKIATIGKRSGKVTIKRTGIVRIRVTDENGSAEAMLTVVPKRNKAKAEITGDGKIKVKLKTDIMADGYQVQISRKRDFSSQKKNYYIKNEKKDHVIISKFNKKKVYYIRTRSYIMKNGKRIYGSYSKTIRVRV
ncbi:MAG: leucine-rich repeat protein [Lachnospiraceae bacterium]